MRVSRAPSALGCRFLKTGELSKLDIPRRSAGLGNNQEIEGGHPVADNQEPEHGSRGKRPGNHRDGRGRCNPYVLEPAEVTNLVVAVRSIMASGWLTVRRQPLLGCVLVSVIGFRNGSRKQWQQQTKQQQGHRQQWSQPNGLPFAFG